jgi:hypothetical protein
MTRFAYLLGPRVTYTPDSSFLLAGLVAVVVAVLYALFRDKRSSLGRSYQFWLFLGSGVCLIVLGALFGSEQQMLDVIR